MVEEVVKKTYQLNAVAHDPTAVLSLINDHGRQSVLRK
jgi:hypothetical protein